VTRILEIECQFTDDYLTGHAMRVGLAGDQTSADTLERLLPTIRNDLEFEADQIRDAGFENYTRMRETAPEQHNIDAITQFLAITPDKASEITSSDYLFSD